MVSWWSVPSIRSRPVSSSSSTAFLRSLTGRAVVVSAGKHFPREHDLTPRRKGAEDGEQAAGERACAAGLSRAFSRGAYESARQGLGRSFDNLPCHARTHAERAEVAENAH